MLLPMKRKQWKVRFFGYRRGYRYRYGYSLAQTSELFCSTCLTCRSKELLPYVCVINQRMHFAGKIKLSDTFDTANTDKFRQFITILPLYGWMNDANGLVYKDGEYMFVLSNTTLLFQMEICIGDIPSRSFVHWEHLPPAIARDTLGHIFSGSSVVDKENVAGCMGQYSGFLYFC